MQARYTTTGIATKFPYSSFPGLMAVRHTSIAATAAAMKLKRLKPINASKAGTCYATITMRPIYTGQTEAQKCLGHESKVSQFNKR